jgi:hypothetical protein
VDPFSGGFASKLSGVHQTGSPAILMIERIQAIDLLWDRTEYAIKRYQYALKVVESGEKVPIGNRTDRSSSKARKNRISGLTRS